MKKITIHRRFVASIPSVLPPKALYCSRLPILGSIWKLHLETKLPECEIRFRADNLILTDWLRLNSRASYTLDLSPCGWPLDAGRNDLFMEIINHGEKPLELNGLWFKMWGWIEI